MALIPPIINGVRYDVSSYEIRIDGRPLSSSGFKSLSYSDGLEPGEVYGQSPQKIGRTRGKYTAEGSMELWLDESIEFETRLTTGHGLSERVFKIDVMVAESGRPPIHTELVGCRIKKRDNEMPGVGGSDAASVKYELDVMFILRDGKSLITNPKLG